MFVVWLNCFGLIRLCETWKRDLEAIGVRLAYIDRLTYGGNVQRECSEVMFKEVHAQISFNCSFWCSLIAPTIGCIVKLDLIQHAVKSVNPLTPLAHHSVGPCH